MILDDLIITRRSSERLICAVAIFGIALLKQYLFSLLALHPQWLNCPIYSGPTYEGQAEFSAYGSPLGLPRLLNKYVTNQFRMALARKQMSLSFILIIKLMMRMAAMHKAIVSAMHIVTLFLVHEITLPAIHIEFTRHTTSIARAYHAYKVFQNYQEAAAHLTAW